MIDLKQILQNNPNCVASRATFKAILLDYYPNEKRTINILTAMVECGLANRIKDKAVVTSDDKVLYLAILENEYGVSPEYSAVCIDIWAAAFGLTVPENVPLRKKSEIITHKPIAVSPPVSSNSSDYEIRIENGYGVITRFIGFDNKTIVIPNKINDVEIKVIGESAFANCTGIECVIISDGIEEIQDGAFFKCAALRTVDLPSTLKFIGTKHAQYTQQGTFAETGLETIVFPASLIYIGSKAFASCHRLKQINLPNKIRTLEKKCFYSCMSLSEVLLPDNLVSIGKDAFYGTAITSINIPTSVKQIAESAFSNCKKLSQIFLHEGLIEIDSYAFRNCSALNTITIPKSVTVIGDKLFEITGYYQPSDRRKKGWKTSENNKNLVISCYAGSAGLSYARKEGYQIRNAMT